jgi:transposase InsO family protein
VKRKVSAEAFTIPSSVTMERFSIETLGRFPADKDGNIYIIVIIDCFSRYVELYPAADCTAEAAARAIVEHFGTFGIPKVLLSDNGSQYANQVIGQLAKLTDMSLMKTIPYSHEENGIVERANKEVLRHLRATFDAHADAPWSVLLPLVKRIMNATIHSSTGFAPAAVITPGLDLNEGLIFPHKADNDDPIIVSEYLRILADRQGDIVRRVQATLGARTASNKRKFDATHTAQVFADGSYVLMNYPKGTRPPTKLHTPRMGPFQVLSHKGADYELVNLVTGKPLHRHISELTEFNAARCSPAEVATRSTPNYLVQHIVAHTGKTAQRAQMRFQVRWLGYGPDDDTLEPWKSLNNNWVFHQYCREQNLLALIPSAFASITLPTNKLD